MIDGWKDIPNYEGLYQINKDGEVKSLERYVPSKGGSRRIVRERILKQNISNGYFVVELNKDCKGKTFRIHQLVAMAFLNHTPCGYDLVVDHINNNPLDNRLENLQLISQRENSIKDNYNKTGFTGVSWNEDSKLYEARLRVDGNKFGWIGSAPSPIIASMMYEFEARKHERSC